MYKLSELFQSAFFLLMWKLHPRIYRLITDSGNVITKRFSNFKFSLTLNVIPYYIKTEIIKKYD